MNRKSTLHGLLATVLAAGIGGCASIEAHEAAEAERLASIRTFVAEQELESLEHARFGLRPRWSTIDDRHLVLWKGNRTPVLITLDAPCRDLEWAHAIRVSHFGGLNHIRAGVDTISPLRLTPTEFDGRYHGAQRVGEWPLQRCRVERMHAMDRDQLELLRQQLTGEGAA